MADIYIKSSISTAHHRKTLRLSRMLCIKVPQALGHLHLLWYWAMENAQDGDITHTDPIDLATIAEWDGAPQDFYNALMECGGEYNVGFIEKTDDGRVVMHDWGKHSGSLFIERQNIRERVSKCRDKKRTKMHTGAKPESDVKMSLNKDYNIHFDKNDKKARNECNRHVTVTSGDVTVTTPPCNGYIAPCNGYVTVTAEKGNTEYNATPQNVTNNDILPIQHDIDTLLTGEDKKPVTPVTPYMLNNNNNNHANNLESKDLEPKDLKNTMVMRLPNLTFCSTDLTFSENAPDDPGKNVTEQNVTSDAAEGQNQKQGQNIPGESENIKTKKRKMRTEDIAELEDAVTASEIVDLWRLHAVPAGLPNIQVLTEQRRKAIRARLREADERRSVEWWRDYFRRIASSWFIVTEAKANRRWVSFDWFLNGQNMAKVCEGKYDTTPEQEQESAMEALRLSPTSEFRRGTPGELEFYGRRRALLKALRAQNFGGHIDYRGDIDAFKGCMTPEQYAEAIFLIDHREELLA